jgi:hypothetical protein
MDRRVVATVAVVALFSLAGCSALPVFDGPESTAPATSTPTTTPTVDRSPTATPAPLAYPDGYGARGVLDGEAAVESHQRALGGYDSYRFRFDVGVGNESGTTDAFVYLVRVEPAAERALEIRDDASITRFQYYENDRLYLKVEVGDAVTYNSTDLAFPRGRLTGIQFLVPLFEHVEYGGPTIRENENGTFYRYRSETVTNASAIIPANVTNEEIDSFDVSLIVHEDGPVRVVRYEAVTTRGTELSVLATVEGINGTAVERPDWYEQAADS